MQDTIKSNAKNKSQQTVCYNGEVFTLRQCAELLGVKVKYIYYRIDVKKMSLEDACAFEFSKKEKQEAEAWYTQKKKEKSLKKKRSFPKELTLDGETHSLREWASILDVSPSTIRWRIKKNLPIEEILCPRTRKKKNTKKSSLNVLAIA